ncbi:MAG: hypothetical protein JSU07_08060 [Bacteroidetes bacterium]|nr:hypothetical protein [Bacteroidota bacterium]
MLLTTFVFSQQLALKVFEKSNAKDVIKLNYLKKHESVQSAINEITSIIETLHQKSYLLAGADSVKNDSTTVYAYLNCGRKYKWAKLSLGNLNPNVASEINISEKLFSQQSFRYNEVLHTINKIIAYYENSGYPFASVKLDSIACEKDELSAKFDVSVGKFFKIDSIKVEGNIKTKQKFLFRYLGIFNGMPYSTKQVSAISKKVLQLPFIKEKQAPIVRLTDRKNKMILFFDSKKASQFDGIIGFLPDAVTKKTVITGDVKIKLVNGIFRTGETVDLQWRRLQSQTQDLKAAFIYPYIAGTPVGFNYGIKLYRKDTTFIDVNNNIGLQYYFKGLNNFRVFYKQRNSNLISTSGYNSISTLPEYADIITLSYGTGITYEVLDYKFNPHKGISFNANVQTGNRTINKNPNVNDAAYQGLLLKSIQYQYDAELNYFIQIKGNSVLHIGIQSASIFGNSTLFRNELLRIGGLRTLRGFNEESIYTSTYVIPTLEYRFLYSQNSNILLFAEGAWYENASRGFYLKDTPLSFGAGINFETKAGILSLNYAIGNQFGSGFDARNGKIHFGLTTLF